MEQPPRRSLFWIASYPKSGNTWLRIFLANYLLGGEDPLPINSVGQLGYADADARHYERAHHGAYDLGDAAKTVALRNRFLLRTAITGPKVALVKTHNYNSTINETPLIPASFTRGAIYVARHPGDVAVSFASHYGLSIDDAIDRMNERSAVIGGADGTALQFTSDWSSHVNSWAGAKTHNPRVIRYEDMHNAPQETFGRVLRHLGVAIEKTKLDRAINNSRFEELKRQEKADGFSENTPHQPRFFRTGIAGGWRDILSSGQIKKLTRDHQKTMKALGYA
jgi:hypothetical protein